jgi:phosphate transport system substrate-binding protein
VTFLISFAVEISTVGRRGAIVAVAIAAIVAVGITVALLQPGPGAPPDEDGGTVIANGTESAPKEIVSVVSARSAFPFVQRWVSQYNNDEDAAGSIEVGYYLAEPDAPSDLAILGDIRHAANGSHSIPVSAQAVAIVYNIPSFPDIPSGMKLNASILSSILNGTTTRWDDPAIKSLNRDMNLPAERIIVVHEDWNSSSLVLLEMYLSTDVRWPSNSLSVLGPDELAATIRKTPYSIGYVDFSYATQTRMTFAAVDAGGRYVVPSMGSIGRAIELQNFTSGDFVMNVSRFDNSSYPVTGLYYASWHADSANATLDLVNWTIDKGKGQQTLSEVQYPPMYQNNQLLMTQAETMINSTLRQTRD